MLPCWRVNWSGRGNYSKTESMGPSWFEKSLADLLAIWVRVASTLVVRLFVQGKDLSRITRRGQHSHHFTTFEHSNKCSRVSLSVARPPFPHFPGHMYEFFCALLSVDTYTDIY